MNVNNHRSILRISEQIYIKKMTNEALYQLICTNVAQYNHWRLDNPEVTIDFSGKNFHQQDLCDALFVNVNLEGANLSDANVEYASFCGSNLKNVNAKGCFATGAHFGAIEVVDGNFSETFLKCLKSGANLDNADFSQADLAFANFRQCSLSNTHFHSANLEHTHFANTNHTEAMFDGAAMEHAFFS